MEEENKPNEEVAEVQEHEGAYVSLRHINKIYDNNVQAVFDFNLDIKQHEFIVFVGPSGCGKSTTLRMIAGLEDITSGELYIDGAYANDMESKDRDIAMVFQSYALYPHMTVYNNLAFGLKIRHLSKEEIDERVHEAAKILQIEEYLDRKPKALSGGQRQRVALGRAIVRRAKVFLMDEPLSNLDAKLRVQMRSEIVRLHDSLNATTIYVTHDQTEAMTMADRIVVMKAGRIQQVGAPKEIYDHPANLFVATFIGSPSMNIISATYEYGMLSLQKGIVFELPEELKTAHDEFYRTKLPKLKEKLEKERQTLDKWNQEPIKPHGLFAKKDNYFEKEKAKLEESLKKDEETLAHWEAASKGEAHKVLLGIRPENIHNGERSIDCPWRAALKISVAELLGAEYYIHCPFQGQDLVATFPAQNIIKAGDEAELAFHMNRAHLFDPDSEEAMA